jgi:putative glycerol-1-phosphate prenyltransferase
MVLFPGNPSQISKEADAFCSCPYIRKNSDYLIGHQVKQHNSKTNQLKIISTGYILVDGGNETAVEE